MLTWKITSYNPITKETVCTESISKKQIHFTIPSEQVSKEQKLAFIKSKIDSDNDSGTITSSKVFQVWKFISILEFILIIGLLFKVYYF